MRKELEHKQKQEETYDFFPFVASELIGKHREGVKIQMRNDFNTYLQSKTGSSFFNPTGSRHNGLYRSTDLSRAQNCTPQLMDSCYVTPANNPRVFKDDHPVKRQVSIDALKRYQESIGTLKQANERDLKNLYETVANEREELEKKGEAYRLKQRVMGRDLKEQMTQKVRTDALTLF